MENIKLVIWDLDETFWKGTLSEEGITPIERNIRIVKELCDRGIINSIVSKNNFEEAKEKLIEIGVWDYFIFPMIEWSAKGPLIKELIERCQLRTTNVPFIDDNHLNLEEAKYFNPELNVLSNESINEILSHDALKGKNDKKHSRLMHYKILEEKLTISKKYTDNKAFLRDSDIRIRQIEGKELFEQTERVVELLARTNQLNFTKERSSKEELTFLLNNKKFKSVAINVFDKFGDYGIVGFYSLDVSNHYLKHFTFSCRILNLGIEQFLYSYLNFPKIDVIPDVAINLDKSKPDWVGIEKQTDKIYNKNLTTVSNNLVFFKGGCDLGQMIYYLKNRGFSFVEETNYVANNNFPIHQEHTQVLLDSKQLSEEDKNFVQTSDFIPFVDDNYYISTIFNHKYKAIVYSVLMDYTNDLYKSKTRNIILPIGGYYNSWADEKNDEILKDLYESRNIKISDDTFKKFRDEFEYLGQISVEKFNENLMKIRLLIHSDIPIIFINGAELESPNIKEKYSYERHIIMNNALDKFISETDNVYLLDIRKIVNRNEMIPDNLRHYNRESYQKISIKLLKMLKLLTDLEVKEKINKIVITKEKILRNKLLRKLYNKSKYYLTKLKKANKKV